MNNNNGNDEVKVDENTYENEVENKDITECGDGVTEAYLIDQIKELESKVVLYKYFPEIFKPFDYNMKYYSIDQYLSPPDDGGGCVISERYLYLKKENLLYFLTIGSEDEQYVDLEDYNSLSLWVSIKDHIIVKDKYYKENFFIEYCIFPTKYDYSDTYKIEIRECGGRPFFNNPGKLIAIYTTDLNTKKFTLEDFR